MVQPQSMLLLAIAACSISSSAAVRENSQQSQGGSVATKVPTQIQNGRVDNNSPTVEQEFDSNTEDWMDVDKKLPLKKKKKADRVGVQLLSGQVVQIAKVAPCSPEKLSSLLHQAVSRNGEKEVMQLCLNNDISQMADPVKLAQIIPFANPAVAVLLSQLHRAVGLEVLLQVLNNPRLLYLTAYIDCSLLEPSAAMFASRVAESLSTIVEGINRHAVSSVLCMLGNTVRVLQQYGHVKVAQMLAAIYLSKSPQDEAEQRLSELFDNGLLPDFVFEPNVLNVLGTTIVLEQLKAGRNAEESLQIQRLLFFQRLAQHSFVPAPDGVARHHVKQLRVLSNADKAGAPDIHSCLVGLASNDFKTFSASEAYAVYLASRDLGFELSLLLSLCPFFDPRPYLAHCRVADADNPRYAAAVHTVAQNETLRSMLHRNFARLVTPELPFAHILEDPDRPFLRNDQFYTQ